MPRYRRIFLRDIPLHIIHRGHDRQPVFVQPEDYAVYLANLAETKVRYGVDVLAYCLMTNHVHLVLSPRDEPENISRLMRVLAARQTRYINKLERRTGTLWEGRFKASLIDTDNYLLACCRYVDLNPVRAKMVASPGDYQWSSYRGRAGLSKDDLPDTFPTLEALGSSKRDRAHAYRDFVRQAIPDAELKFIRDAVQRNQLTGNAPFVRQIAHRTGRRISTQPQGRPGRKK